ncbi:MAG: hypothetical protein EXR69_16070 [Myxococcales bacterium]|nr:hypothetical protein [Myxococcales bacterium]
MLLSLLLSVLGANALAAAPNVTVNITLPAAAQQAGLDEAAMEQALSDAIASELHMVDLSAYMDQMANANVLSAKGLGVDYASNMQRFELGGGIGTAVNGAGFAFTSGEGLPETGFALQIGLMGGLNLGVLSGKDSALRRIRLYVNGMSATTKRDPFSATFLNYGGHLQIQLLKGGKKTSGVRWGGLDLTSGYEFSSYALALGKALPVSSGDLTWDASGTMTLKATAESIPVELSTSFHIFVVTGYFGAAGDTNLSGTSEAEIGIEGPISLMFNGADQAIGAASAAVNQGGVASTFTTRVFAGAQVDIVMVKLYGQLNVTLDKSVGGHLGVRVAL